MKAKFWLFVVLGAIAYFSVFGWPEFLDKRPLGQKVYEDRCSECHGVDGRGTTLKYLSNSVMNLVDDEWTHVYDDDTAITFMIQEGIIGEMPPNEDLTREEIKALLAYLKELRRKS